MASRRDPGRRRRAGTALSITIWCYLTWVLLTWTLTLEQQLVGLAISAATGIALAPLGEVPGVWRLLVPRRLVGLLVLLGSSAARVVRANISLARRILSPSLPLRSGMTIVPAGYEGAAGLGAVGIITSLAVDNQIVDLDRDQRRLQYHAVDVPTGSAAAKRAAINGPTEDALEPLLREPLTHPEESP